jgi:hypothetical protein
LLPARSASAAISRCLRLAVTYAFYSGNAQQSVPARSDPANELVTDPSKPHSYRARAAQTTQQPDLAVTRCGRFALVIRSGSVIGRAPIVSMPHWAGIIPDSQLRALVAYIKTLKTG